VAFETRFARSVQAKLTKSKLGGATRCFFEGPLAYS